MVDDLKPLANVKLPAGWHETNVAGEYIRLPLANNLPLCKLVIECRNKRHPEGHKILLYVLTANLKKLYHGKVYTEKTLKTASSKSIELMNDINKKISNVRRKYVKYSNKDIVSMVKKRLEEEQKGYDDTTLYKAISDETPIPVTMSNLQMYKLTIKTSDSNAGFHINETWGVLRAVMDFKGRMKMDRQNRATVLYSNFNIVQKTPEILDCIILQSIAGELNKRG